MAGSGVHVEMGGRVLRLTLDRPPVNVLDRRMLDDLAAALRAAADEVGADVVLLTGAGRAFCAGVEVADHTADRVAGMIESFHRVIEALLDLEQPVIAAVNGAALGGGLELVLACDVALLKDGARLGQPETLLGVFPPAAAALLPRLIGRQRALDLILTGRTVTASEAYGLGLASQVFEPGDYEAGVEQYVSGLAAQSGPVLRLAKRAVREGLELPLSDALARADRLYLDELMRLSDAHEGIAAFMEKRQPVWSGS